MGDDSIYDGWETGEMVVYIEGLVQEGPLESGDAPCEEEDDGEWDTGDDAVLDDA